VRAVHPPQPAPRPGGGAGTLSGTVADRLRERLERGDWRPRERLPTEHELSAEYGVSRATIRTALRTLESRGLTVTRHGVGTFATAATGAVTADLQRLESISQTITRLGRRPGARFRSIGVRPADAAEAAALLLPTGGPVLSTQREITADGEVVAYSHDLLPRDVLGDAFDARTVTGSLFAVLEQHGVVPVSAVAELHASLGQEIGWAEQPPGTLYLMLEQTHFDAGGRTVAWSRTWFIEGRFRFDLVRVR